MPTEQEVKSLKARGFKLTGPGGGTMRYMNGETPSVKQLKSVFDAAIAAANEKGDTARANQLEDIRKLMEKSTLSPEEIDKFLDKITNATTVDELPTNAEIKDLMARGLSNINIKVKDSEDGETELPIAFFVKYGGVSRGDDHQFRSVQGRLGDISEFITGRSTVN